MQFFEREMVNQQTRQISILCFRVVLFEVVLEILFDFPHRPSKNVECRGFLLFFSRAHIEPEFFVSKVIFCNSVYEIVFLMRSVIRRAR